MSDSRTDVIKQILRNMKNKHEGHYKGGIMLSGNPGTGKTSMVRDMAKMLGLDLFVIEVPHITEEHIINIPFIHIDADGAKSTGKTQLEKTGGYSLIMSKSNLFSQIEAASPKTDEELLKDLAGNKMLAEQAAGIGFKADKIPGVVEDIRARYRSILFLDEFYRNTSTSIRNIMRGILNNKIGDHTIPKDVYVMYASNMEDEGLDNISMNQQFEEIELQTVDKDEWFKWFLAKHGGDKGLNMKVVSKFQNTLIQEHMSHDDLEAEVRTSPRRWEQILLYISAAFPITSEKEASSLLANVQAMFRNYETGANSKLSVIVMRAVEELLDKEGYPRAQAASSKDWKSTLDHQVVAAMKLGHKRSYVPVISGEPGIGKTSVVAEIALNHNLRFIDIDVSTLSSDDIVGLPLPGKQTETGMDIKFTKPPLLRRIEESIKTHDAAYLAKATPEKRKEYAKQQYKYLIFFDEMNRPSDPSGNIRTFNALRRVLLEREFGHNMPLPEGSILVGAINPTDLGTTQFTSHARDVLDIIPATPSWKECLHYISQMKHPGTDTVGDTALAIIKAFGKRFRDGNDKGMDPEFTLAFGVYMSQREYCDMFINICTALTHAQDDREDQVTNTELRRDVFKAMKGTLTFILRKHSKQKQQALDTLEEWMLTSKDFNIGEGVVFYRNQGDSLQLMIAQAWDDPIKLAHNPDYATYLRNHTLADIATDVVEAYKECMSTEAKVEDLYFNTVPWVHLNATHDDLMKDGTVQLYKSTSMACALLFGAYLSGMDYSVIDALRRVLMTAPSKALNAIGMGDAFKDHPAERTPHTPMNTVGDQGIERSHYHQDDGKGPSSKAISHEMIMYTHKSPSRSAAAIIKRLTA